MTHFFIKPIILTKEYCSNIDIFKKYIEWIKVVSLVTLDFKTVSGFRSDKSNCRKLLKQSIICSASFFITSIKDIERRYTELHQSWSIYYFTVDFLLEHINNHWLIWVDPPPIRNMYPSEKIKLVCL